MTDDGTGAGAPRKEASKAAPLSAAEQCFAQAWQHLGLVPPAQPDLFG